MRLWCCKLSNFKIGFTQNLNYSTAVIYAHKTNLLKYAIWSCQIHFLSKESNFQSAAQYLSKFMDRKCPSGCMVFLLLWSPVKTPSPFFHLLLLTAHKVIRAASTFTSRILHCCYYSCPFSLVITTSSL